MKGMSYSMTSSNVVEECQGISRAKLICISRIGRWEFQARFPLWSPDDIINRRTGADLFFETPKRSAQPDERGQAQAKALA